MGVIKNLCIAHLNYSIQRPGVWQYPFLINSLKSGDFIKTWLSTKRTVGECDPFGTQIIEIVLNRL